MLNRFYIFCKPLSASSHSPSLIPLLLSEQSESPLLLPSHSDDVCTHGIARMYGRSAVSAQRLESFGTRVCVSDGERETDRQTDSKTDSKTDRQTDR